MSWLTYCSWVVLAKHQHPKLELYTEMGGITAVQTTSSLFSVCFLSCRHNQLLTLKHVHTLCKPQNPWESPLPGLCWLLFRGSLSGSLPVSEAAEWSWGCHKSNSIAVLRVGKGKKNRRGRAVCYYKFTGEAQPKSGCKQHLDGFVLLCKNHQLGHV